MGIRSLARELNLSIGTVSRALNDRPDVNPATRARVKAAAAVAGYEPNQSGRSLRKGCTGMIAAVIPTMGVMPAAEPVFFKVLEGARRTLFAEGVDLMVLFRGPGEEPLANLRRFVSRRVADGLIITQTRASDPRIGYLQHAGMKFVAFGRSAGCDGYPWVDFDFEGVAAQAVRLFVAAGHRRLALVTNHHDLNYNDLMQAAFRAEAARHGLGAQDVVQFDAQDDRLSVASMAALAAAPPPTAYLAGNEAIAAGLYVDLAAMGRPVGEASAVISAMPAHNPLCHAPPLTSFETDLDAIGCALAEQLLAVLPGVEARPAPPLGPARAELAPRASHLVRTPVTA